MNAPSTSPRPRIRHNDYTALTVPEPGNWSPRLSVSVLVPAYGHQEKLDLTLAALAAQTYPAHLVEVLVVDDGSLPPLRLPEIRPERTRLLTPDPGGRPGGAGLGWGSALAVDTAARAAEGEVLHRIDADMLVYRDHLEAMARWHHVADYLVVLGYKSFVENVPGRYSAADVRAAVAAGAADALFDPERSVTSWSEQVFADTGGLLTTPHRAYRACNGATISFTPWMYRECGGMDTALALGSDLEIGYRMAQAGAVFVPEPRARAWHLGIPQMRGPRREEGTRVREPSVSQRVPMRRDWRRYSGRQWLVPYVDVVVDAAAAGYEAVRASVAAALAGTLPDVRVTIVAPWSRLDAQAQLAGEGAGGVAGAAGRLDPLADPLIDLRLIREAFGHDGRVRLRESLPPDSAPVPFRFTCPAGWMLEPDALARLIELSDADSLGVVYLAAPRGAELSVARLDRTQALARARLLRSTDEDLDDAVHELFGTHWMDGTEWALAPATAERPGRDAGHWKRQADQWKRKAGALQKEVRKLEREAARLRQKVQAPLPAKLREGLGRRLTAMGLAPRRARAAGTERD
jgi:GT2 family glycosyltransferase